MRYSQLFGKTTKSAPADAESVNARLLTQGGFISKQMAGVYNYLPLGLRVLNKIQNIVREEMNALGASELLLPALTAEENYVATGRDQTMVDVLFKLEGAGGTKLVLNPTHEEIVTPLVKKFVFSYRDLPLAVYQIQNKFRNEPRTKSGLLRGREFNMKDLYSFHTTKEDLDSFYERVTKAYQQIYLRLGIGDCTYLTFASGGTFSRYSHEFQTVSEVGEDLIYICEKCHLAVNREIIEEHNYCPQCSNVDLAEKTAIEVGNIFKQSTKFTQAFACRFTDETGVEHDAEMGAYGIGPSRIMGTLVEIFHDDRGIIWPETVAPFKVHLVRLGTDEDVVQNAEQLYTEFCAKHVEVLFDDREKATAGEKLSDADLIGIPYRVVVSKKTIAGEVAELKKREETKVELISLKDIVAKFFE